MSDHSSADMGGGLPLSRGYGDGLAVPYTGKYPALVLPCPRCGGPVKFRERAAMGRASGCPACRWTGGRREFAKDEPGICPDCGGMLFRVADHRRCRPEVTRDLVRPIWRINGQIVTSSPWFLQKVKAAGKLEGVLRGERGVLLGAQLDDTTLGVVRSTTAKGQELRLLLDRGPDGSQRISFRWLRQTPDRGLMFCRGGLCWVDGAMALDLLEALKTAVVKLCRLRLGEVGLEGGIPS